MVIIIVLKPNSVVDLGQYLGQARVIGREPELI
jgi:hypothetical protein